MAAPGRASWLNSERLAAYSAAVLLLFLLFEAFWTLLAASHGLMDPTGIPLGHVFIEFWTAGRAALGPEPAAIYDLHRFYALQQAVIADVRPLYPWHYPPILLLFLAPLAFLPYLAALPLWYLANIAGYLALARRLAREQRFLWLALAFPGLLLALHIAQFGPLLTAALGMALLLLDARPRLAGLLLALLATKPHLFPLVPLALLASRRLEAFASAAVGVLLLVAASWLAFGGASWTAMLRDLGGFGAAPQPAGEAFLLWNWQPSVFMMLRTLGLGSGAAGLAQALAALGAAAAVVWVWRRPAPPALQGAALVSADLLVSPYVYNYDLVLLALPLVWLGRHGAEQGWLSGEKAMLLLAWLLPILIVPLADLLGVQVGALPLAALLGLLCRRIAHERARGREAAHG